MGRDVGEAWKLDGLENDVETILGLDEADVLDNVVVVQAFEEVNFGLQWYYQSATSAPRFP